MAYEAGKAHRPMDDALIADGFACHFLTDAFSASHARTPRLSIKEYWDKQVPGFDHKFQSWLVRRIDKYPWGAAKRAGAIRAPTAPAILFVLGAILGGLAPPVGVGVGSVIAAVGGHFGATGRIKDVAKEQLAIMLSGGDWGVGNVVSLVIHDYEGFRGVQATIQGKPIELAGDKDLMVETKAKLPHNVDKPPARLNTTGAAEETYVAAVNATRASIREVDAAFRAGWSGQPSQVYMAVPFGWSKPAPTALSDVKGQRPLYAAEELIPIPVEDSKLPEGQRAVTWMHRSVEEFLNDERVLEALRRFGDVEAPTFADMLAANKAMPKEALDAVKNALITPLGSHSGKKIADVLRAIIRGD